jgi:hypothetical protein
MSSIAKLTVLVAVITIGANQMVSLSAPDLADVSSIAPAQVSPHEIMHAGGGLPEVKFESYEWVFPVL